MRIAHLVRDTDAEGPGRRFALWTQGCALRCPGCCNPELFGEGGEVWTVDALIAEIASTEGIEGISILGGEPTEQPDLLVLCEKTRALGLTVMLYSGHLRATIEAHHPGLLDHVDLLVDGPYVARERDTSRRWIGSRNQRLHVLSDAYEPAMDPRFSAGQSVEIRLEDGEITVNGWPDLARALNRRHR